MAKDSVASLDTLREHGGDVLRKIVEDALKAIMESEVSALCNASYRERSQERTNSRNGYRYRDWDTRVGRLNLAIPRVREDSYLPCFLEPRRRVEKALYAVICEAYIHGVSTRAVDRLVEALGGSGISKSQVSRICGDIDEQVRQFLQRPLEGRFPYVWLDATFVKVRHGARIVERAVVVAIGLNESGRREALGIACGHAETEEFWTEFLRHLLDRGLRGVELVVSDHHSGLRKAARQCLATQWQRCRVHFMRNLLSRTPRAQKGYVRALVATVFQQASAADAVLQWDAVRTQIEKRLPEVARLMEQARDDVLAFMQHPPRLWSILASTNSLERLNCEIKRRADVVQIFPNDDSVIRLIGAVLMEQHDEWQVVRRQFSNAAMGLPSNKDDAILARGIGTVA